MEPLPAGGLTLGLAEPLQLLSARDQHAACTPGREPAARALLAELQRWAPMVIWKSLRAQLRELNEGEAEHVIADAVQSLVVIAATSAHGFRGHSESAARAWCRRVLVSHVSNELRIRRAARRIPAAEEGATGAPEPESPFGSTSERSRLSEAMSLTLGVFRQLRDRVYATRRQRDAESTMRAIWCYWTYLAGATLEEQVRALGDGTTLLDDRKRARNRVYKLRERGRNALRELASQLNGTLLPWAAGTMQGDDPDFDAA